MEETRYRVYKEAPAVALPPDVIELTSSPPPLRVPQMDPKFLRNQRYAKKHNKAAE